MQRLLVKTTNKKREESEKNTHICNKLDVFLKTKAFRVVMAIKVAAAEAVEVVVEVVKVAAVTTTVEKPTTSTLYSRTYIYVLLKNYIN